MSMTKEEAFKQYEEWRNLGFGHSTMPSSEVLVMAMDALRPITREQAEKMRGEWEPGNPICPICGKDKFDGLDADIWADWMPNFCPACGAPMTDEAVDMVMERLEEICK